MTPDILSGILGFRTLENGERIELFYSFKIIRLCLMKLADSNQRALLEETLKRRRHYIELVAYLV